MASDEDDVELFNPEPGVITFRDLTTDPSLYSKRLFDYCVGLLSIQAPHSVSYRFLAQFEHDFTKLGTIRASRVSDGHPFRGPDHEVLAVPRCYSRTSPTAQSLVVLSGKTNSRSCSNLTVAQLRSDDNYRWWFNFIQYGEKEALHTFLPDHPQNYFLENLVSNHRAAYGFCLSTQLQDLNLNNAPKASESTTTTHDPLSEWVLDPWIYDRDFDPFSLQGHHRTRTRTSPGKGK